MRRRLRLLPAAIPALAAALLLAGADARAAGAAADSTATAKVKTKHVFLAMGMSVIVPSSGQFYNGEAEKGMVMVALIGAGFVMREIMREEDDKALLGDPGSWVIALTWAWSIFDAPISAARVNEERRRAAGLALSLSPRTGSPRLGVTVAF